MSFSDGEAFLTPNESKPSEPAGMKSWPFDPSEEVQVVALSDVPRGESARIEALIATEFDADVGLQPVAVAWNAGVFMSATLLATLRDQVQRTLTDHFLRPRPVCWMGEQQRAARGEALTTDLELYTAAVSNTQAFGITAQSTLAVAELADRDFRELCKSLRASGHITERFAGAPLIEGERLAAEGDQFRAEAREAGIPGMHRQETGPEALFDAHRALKTATHKMAAAVLELRSVKAGEAAARGAAEAARLERDLALAGQLDGLVSLLGGLFPAVEAFLGKLEKGQMPLLGTGGFLGQLVAGDKPEQLRRVQALLHSRQVTARTNHELAVARGIACDLEAFEMAFERFGRTLAAVQVAAMQRRDDLGLVGARLDGDARQKRQLDQSHERFEPIGQRLARLEAAKASNRVAKAVTATCLSDAQPLAEPITTLTTSGSDAPDLTGLRQHLGSQNVIRQVGRNITRLGPVLSGRDTILSAATKVTQ